jgi:hypothetical protein
MRRPFLLLGVVVLVCTMVTPVAARSAAPADTSSPQPTAASTRPHPPVLAYFYIWFDKTSWRRGKTDYPLIGRYSSDDPSVVRKQVRLAKRAGIEGFIVSWKHTPTLDRRLAQLIAIAEDERFKLAIIYQGLDFHREPLPTETVARDLAYFTSTFAGRAPFGIFAKPLVIWSGTWRFSATDIDRVTSPLRGSLAILASEKNVAGYARVAAAVDGDAYYWSSVNPATFKGYIEKLADLSGTVHGKGGLWVAPAAVGFDARKVGGTTVVPRAGGANLLTQIDAALASAPDAIGLISWNEFSENSHLEPSRKYGFQALDTVSDRLGTGTVLGSTRAAAPARRAEGATRRPAASPPGGPSAPIALTTFGALIALVVIVGVRRARRAPRLRVVGMDVSPRPMQTTRTPDRARSRPEIMAERRRRAGARRRSGHHP